MISNNSDVFLKTRKYTENVRIKNMTPFEAASATEQQFA